MSKNHVADGTSSIDDELDNYILTHQVKPVVPSTDSGIDLFGGGPDQKKKSFLERLLIKLRQLLRVHLAA